MERSVPSEEETSRTARRSCMSLAITSEPDRKVGMLTHRTQVCASLLPQSIFIVSFQYSKVKEKRNGKENFPAAVLPQKKLLESAGLALTI